MAPALTRRSLLRVGLGTAALALPMVPALPATVEAAPVAPQTFKLFALLTRADGSQTSVMVEMRDGTAILWYYKPDRGEPTTVDPAFITELFRLAEQSEAMVQ